MVAKLTKEPPLKRTEVDAPKSSSPMSRSTIKQAMRMKCNTIVGLQCKKVLAHLNYFCLLLKAFQTLCNLANDKQINIEQTKKINDILSIFFFLSQAETRNSWRETQPKNLSNFIKKRTKKPEDMSYNSCKWWCHFNNQQNMFNVQLQLTPRNMVTWLSQHAFGCMESRGLHQVQGENDPSVRKISPLSLTIIFSDNFIFVVGNISQVATSSLQ